MANNNNEGVDNGSDSSKDSGLDKSFVGKFVSGLLNNTPLSKWFGKESSSSKSVVRRRNDDEDDEETSYIFQPPVKRVKLPLNIAEHNNYSAHLFESPVTVHNASNNVNNISSKVFGAKFPEPVPGPSGIKSRKLYEVHNSSASTNTISSSFENQEIVNGEHDTDSEESTSGYSSAPKLVNKEQDTENNKTVGNEDNCEKTTPRTRSLFTSMNESSHNRSLFSERSPQVNTSLSSRRPAFNASTFGSPNFVDRTLSTKRILNSPFYNGHTIYGGASAYGRRLGRSAEDFNNSTRASVQIKPVNEKINDNTTLSKTARRILSTLEQYSTPISDAKKIPVTPTREGILSKYIGATPYTMRDREKKRPLHKELQVPTIPELLQMKQKEKLQNSTVSVRQIATTSKSTLNKEEYKLRTEDDNKQKYSNKMKSNMSSLRQKVQPSIEPVSEVKLPKVSLPITTLPKFDFVMMPAQSLNETTTTEATKTPQIWSTENKSTVSERKVMEKKTVENGKTIFTFSDPLVISKDMKVSAINCFKFSEPLCKKQCMNTGVNFKTGDASTGFKMKNNGENLKSSSQLPAGNVTDVLRKKDSSAAVSTTWECPACWVRNDTDETKCIACHEPKSQPVTKAKKSSFGDQFKLTNDKWECSSCMVRNNKTDEKCVACGTKKSSVEKDKAKSTWKCTSCSASNKQDSDKCSCGVSKTNKSAVGFGDKFKSASDTWECSACMIRNKNELDKCEACQTPKAQSKPVGKTVRFENTFKLSTSNTWECPTCMIRNKNDVTKCAACETPKPSEKPPASGSLFNFGIPEWECKTCLVKNKNDTQKCTACGSLKEKKNQKGFSDVFKIKQGEWDCTACLVRNKPSADVCACCGVAKPGTGSEKKEEKKPETTFNFGIDKSSPIPFKFGIPSSKLETKESGKVETIAPSTTQASTAVSTATTVVPILTSTAPVTTSTTPVSIPTFSFAPPAKSSAPTTGGFTFGIATTQETTTPTKSIISTPEIITSSVVSGNPLLKPNEKLPEKVTPASVVGFNKFSLDANKPTASSGSLFGSKPAESNLFANKPTESTGLFSNTTLTPTFTFNVKPTENATSTTSTLSQPEVNNTPPLFKFGADNPQPGIPLKKPFGESNDNNMSNNFRTMPAFGSPQTFGTTENKPCATPESKPFASAENKPFGTTENKLFGAAESKPFGPVSSASSVVSTMASTTPVTTPAPSIHTFSFGPPTKSSASTTSTFPFGIATTQGKTSVNSITSNCETVVPSVASSNPLLKPNEKLPEKVTPAPVGFKFGLDTNKPPESSGSLFGNKPVQSNLFVNKPAESSSLFSNNTLTPAFKFNVKPTQNVTSTTSTISQPEVNNPPPVFKFGSDTSQPVIPLKKPFGESSDNNVSNGFGTVSKIPAFGSPQAFGTTENKPFGTPESKPFGSTENKPFGTTENKPFGMPDSKPFGATENKPFTFGSSDLTPKNSGFPFGQPQPQPEKQITAPVFNFGSTAAVASSVPVPSFNFSSPPNSSFSFGTAGKIESSQPFGSPSTNVFGTGAPGAAKNGSFNFGTSSNNNNQKAVFTFGASQTSQPSFPTQNQTGFNFGATAPPTIPTGGFNFTGAPPSFNFTDGTQSTAPPQRKIKKALRRTHR